ncbi:hypothetical protein [Segatella oulorum]|uniref:hypothetical protein n=1 Tax=Segatella oulorum TaxID=28136 RepID=UPI0036167AC9
MEKVHYSCYIRQPYLPKRAIIPIHRTATAEAFIYHFETILPRRNDCFHEKMVCSHG